MSTDVTKADESLENKEAQAPEETQVSEDAVETEAAAEALAPEAPEADASQAPEAADAPAVEATPLGDGPVVLPELEDYSVFEAYVESLIAAEPIAEGSTVTGKVIAMDDMAVTVSIDDEHSCEIDRDEFLTTAGELTAKVGDEIQVYIDMVDEDGGVHLSKEKADKLALWNSLNKKSRSGEIVRGTINGLAKGGFNVDIGVRAFLPGSQLDTRPRKAKQALGETHDFQITKFDRARGAVILSRRALLEKERAGMKEETLNTLRVGAIMNGFVKNITDYGCFVDVGGIDGLLHITDMSWARITNPRSVVKVGEEITVQVLHFDTGTEKLKLGMKQITEDPWVNFERKYRVGQRIEGKVVNLTDFGAFIEIEDGIEGLVHVSALSWTKHVKKASDVLKKGDTTEAVILDIDSGARRISLGIKQTQPNPWQVLADKMPIGTRVKGPIRSATNFGVFIGIEEGIDGLVHISDLAWDQSIKDPRDHYTVGDELETILLGIDVENERASLGLKQLTTDPWHAIEDRYPIGRVVEGTVVKLLEFGAIVRLEPNVEALVHISEFSEDRVEDLNEVAQVDQVLRAKVINVSADQRKIGLSVKRVHEADASMAMQESEAPTRTTIGDLIAEKIDISQLPEGKDE